MNSRAVSEEFKLCIKYIYFSYCFLALRHCGQKILTLCSKNRTVSIPVYRFKKTFNLGDSTPLELVDQSGKNSVPGYNLREAIYRFTPAERLRSADLTVFDTWGSGTNVRTMPFRAAYIMSVWFSRLYCSGIQSDHK